MKLSPARKIAYETHLRVFKNNSSPELIMEELYENSKTKLHRLDKNLAKEIVYGSLRWHSKIFWILQKTSSRDLNEVSQVVRTALLCGTYQIFYLDKIPDRAAVNESVEFVKSQQESQASSFVNGILRQIARRSAYFPKPDKEKKPVQYLSVQFAHPEWLVERWLERFRFDRCEEILAQNNTAPPISIRINSLKTDFSKAFELQKELLRAEKTHTDRRPLRSVLRCTEFPQLSEESLFAQGYYTIQGESSQLIAPLVDPKEGEVIVDACAGPGGKFSHIYEMTHGKAELHGVERSKTQLAKAKETFQRLGFEENVEFHEADFLKWSPPKPPHKVLLDAPCSGLGVLRQHPEGKWQKSESSISEFADRQKKLIEHGLAMLQKDGELIFSVCSFEPEESSELLHFFKDKYSDKIKVIPPSSRIPDYYRKYINKDELLHIYSGNSDEMDGFSAFILKKTKDF